MRHVNEWQKESRGRHMGMVFDIGTRLRRQSISRILRFLKLFEQVQDGKEIGRMGGLRDEVECMPLEIRLRTYGISDNLMSEYAVVVRNVALRTHPITEDTTHQRHFTAQMTTLVDER